MSGTSTCSTLPLTIRVTSEPFFTIILELGFCCMTSPGCRSGLLPSVRLNLKFSLYVGSLRISSYIMPTKLGISICSSSLGSNRVSLLFQSHTAPTARSTIMAAAITPFTAMAPRAPR